MTIHHLQIFVAVAECGSMSEAARKHHLSQPTVSQLIRELEEHYGTKLFERLSRKLYITESGKKLLSCAKGLLCGYEEMEYTMSQQKRRERIRTGSSVTVGSCLMPDIVRRFSKKCPEVDIFNQVSNTERVEELLLASELDIAVVEGKVKSEELITEQLMDDYVVLFCAGGHRFAARSEVEIDELCRENFVLREKGSGTREIFERFMKERQKPVHTRWEVVSFASTLRAVCEDNCIGAASVRLLAEALDSGQVKAIYEPGGSWDRSFSLVRHRHKFLTEGLSAFIQVAEESSPTVLPERSCMAKLCW